MTRNIDSAPAASISRCACTTCDGSSVPKVLTGARERSSFQRSACAGQAGWQLRSAQSHAHKHIQCQPAGSGRAHVPHGCRAPLASMKCERHLISSTTTRPVTGSIAMRSGVAPAWLIVLHLMKLPCLTVQPSMLKGLRSSACSDVERQGNNHMHRDGPARHTCMTRPERASPLRMVCTAHGSFAWPCSKWNVVSSFWRGSSRESARS